MITAVLSLIGVSLVGSVGFIAASLHRAPEGYQDESGFHHAQKMKQDNPQECEFAVEAVLHHN